MVRASTAIAKHAMKGLRSAAEHWNRFIAEMQMFVAKEAEATNLVRRDQIPTPLVVNIALNLDHFKSTETVLAEHSV